MMTTREQAIVRMHNAGLSDREIIAVLAMRGDEAAKAHLVMEERTHGVSENDSH